jgi:hypothetical protein
MRVRCRVEHPFYDGDTGGLHGTRVVIEKTSLVPNQYINLPDHVTVAVQTTDGRHFTQDAYVGNGATTNSVMISRNRSAPTAAARSIERITSANSTVTCLYSADWVACVNRAPHSPQNLAVGLDRAPQEPQKNPVAVSPPPPSPLGSTSVSFHCWSTMSVISPCHLRREVLRPS